MKSGGNTTKYLWVIFGLLTLTIIAYVLFQYPQPGVADQGDFDRVMFVSGLELKAEDVNNPNFVRFLDYTVTDYKISENNMFSPLSRLKTTSVSYLITLISSVCKSLGQDTFKTIYLAIAYLLMYVFAIYVIIKYLNIENKLKLIFLFSIALFVFLDGNYLVWFNSLYGEPMMITTLMLYIAAWIYYIHNRNVLKSEEMRFSHIILIYVAAFLFLSSKLQVLSALPIILVMLGWLFWKDRHLLKQYQALLLCIFYCILIALPVELALINKDISNDTQYDSVFYGILKDSPNPSQDLIDMGLNPDMAVDAGKHSFLPKGEYIRYVPHSQITQEEFYSKMSNGKLVKFYLTHPARLIQGMQYTASQAFYTSSFLGKYQRAYSETPVRQFNRFTLWSNFRENALPKNLLFIIIYNLEISPLGFL